MELVERGPYKIFQQVGDVDMPNPNCPQEGEIKGAIGHGSERACIEVILRCEHVLQMDGCAITGEKCPAFDRDNIIRNTDGRKVIFEKPGCGHQL